MRVDYQNTTLLTMMLGAIDIGYVVKHQPGTNTIEITWYCYDEIDANSFWERTENPLSMEHRLEAGADLIFDKVFQSWFNFRVSKTETIEL
jgi:hypothetical protein